MLISSIAGAIFIPRIIEIVRQKIVAYAQRECVNQDGTEQDSNTPRHLYLLDQPKISEKQIITFFTKNNPNLDRNYIERIAKLYCMESKQESVNTAVTVAQMALETGFLQFNGSAKKSQNNFAGMGCVCENHQGNSFATIEEGVRAHIQHFKAYASPAPLHTSCVDSRYKFVQKSKFFGKLKTVYDFVGVWAMDEDYGKKLAKLTQDLLSTPNF
jgi:flagellum-specific peptidoglycan hydrolase FlgJ